MNFKAAGTLIRALRKARHWTQRELALRVGISYTYLSKLETGTIEYAPKAAVLAALIQQLECSPHDRDRLQQYYNREPPVAWCPSTILLPDYVG